MKGHMSDHKDAPDVLNVSRRGFLKGFGAGTAATSLLSPVSLREAEAAERGAVGPNAVPLTLNVNGQNRALNVEPRVTLLDALRNRLDLTGPKKVCDRGTCGACTVLLDGKPVYSCSVLALEAEGRQITTVEGLGTPEKMNAVQQAFVKHDAQQCGFCTPGFVTAATAFVRNHPNATIEQVRAGLGGNLCRCGTYAGMLLAVADAAGQKGGA
jgi:xanthine dehydrogenase YagT iron-sulfur-binding subunit